MGRVLVLLGLVASACQTARQAPKSDAELQTLEFESKAQQLTDHVQSSFSRGRERAAAGEPSAADRLELRSSFAENVKQAEAPAVAAAPAPIPSSSSSDAAQFARVKAAIERANREVERRRPRRREP